MKRNVLVFIAYIIECIKKIEEYTCQLYKESFLQESAIQDAVFRRLEIIGEAVKDIPNKFRAKHTDTQWTQIAGLRDMFIHSYFRINPACVCIVIEKDLPILKQKTLNITSSDHCLPEGQK